MLFGVLETITAALLATQKGSGKSVNDLLMGGAFILELSGSSTPYKISSQKEQNCKNRIITANRKSLTGDRSSTCLTCVTSFIYFYERSENETGDFLVLQSRPTAVTCNLRQKNLYL